jgi:hypothetical protein
MSIKVGIHPTSWIRIPKAQAPPTRNSPVHVPSDWRDEALVEEISPKMLLMPVAHPTDNDCPSKAVCCCADVFGQDDQWIIAEAHLRRNGKPPSHT